MNAELIHDLDEATYHRDPDTLSASGAKTLLKYRVSVLRITERAIEVGRDQMAEACRRWLDNGKRVDLPDYLPHIHDVDLPPWAYARTDRTPAGIPADFNWSIHDYA